MCVCVSVYIYMGICTLLYTLILVNIFVFQRLMLFKVQSCNNLSGTNRKEGQTKEEKKSFYLPKNV